MAAKTFEEFWKILEVPHSRQGNDYVFIKELSEVVWKAATKAAEEKFTSTNSAMLEIAARSVIQAFDLNYGKEPFELTIKRLREVLQLQQ